MTSAFSPTALIDPYIDEFLQAVEVLRASSQEARDVAGLNRLLLSCDGVIGYDDREPHHLHARTMPLKTSHVFENLIRKGEKTGHEQMEALRIKNEWKANLEPALARIKHAMINLLNAAFRDLFFAKILSGATVSSGIELKMSIQEQSLVHMRWKGHDTDSAQAKHYPHQNLELPTQKEVFRDLVYGLRTIIAQPATDARTPVWSVSGTFSTQNVTATQFVDGPVRHNLRAHTAHEAVLRLTCGGYNAPLDPARVASLVVAHNVPVRVEDLVQAVRAPAENTPAACPS